MPRPRRCRRIGSNPCFNYFKPAGIGLNELDENVLTIDEYEALRLKDYVGLGQSECSEKMHISQPTFHRLLISARQKVADSIISGKAIRIEDGACGEYCVCSTCGKHVFKKKGVPCINLKCPACGNLLRR